jgi:hypothetical protein
LFYGISFKQPVYFDGAKFTGRAEFAYSELSE